MSVALLPLLDTHAAIWYLAGDTRLSPLALSTIQGTLSTGQRCLISSISIAEMRYLVEKGTVDEAKLEQLIKDLMTPTFALMPVVFDLACAAAMKKIPRSIVPDMPDRMIAATALHLDIRLITKDARIRQTQVVTIW